VLVTRIAKNIPKIAGLFGLYYQHNNRKEIVNGSEVVKRCFG
jgi:hypothetical protein